MTVFEFFSLVIQDLEDLSLRRLLIVLTKFILFSFSLSLSATQTQFPLPQDNTDFTSDVRNFLSNEMSSAFGTMFESFIISGGNLTTSPNLTHTISAITARVNGYYVSQQQTAVTYTPNRKTYVFLDHVDSRFPEVVFSGGGGCTFSQRLTRLVLAECDILSGEDPIPSVKLLQIGFVDTDSSAIISVTDQRHSSPFHEVYVTDPPFNADPTCTNDATAAIQAAINAVQSRPRRGMGTVRFPRGCFIITAPISYNIRPDNPLFAYQTSHLRIEGAPGRGTYLVVTGATPAIFTTSEDNPVQSLEIRNLFINGNTFATGGILLGGVQNVIMERVWINGINGIAVNVQPVFGNMVILHDLTLEGASLPNSMGINVEADHVGIYNTTISNMKLDGISSGNVLLNVRPNNFKAERINCVNVERYCVAIVEAFGAAVLRDILDELPMPPGRSVPYGIFIGPQVTDFGIVEIDGYYPYNTVHTPGFQPILNNGPFQNTISIKTGAEYKHRQENWPIRIGAGVVDPILGNPANPVVNTLYSNNFIKSWVSYDGVANTIQNSFNVSGVAKNGVGDYTFGFVAPFAGGNTFACSAMAGGPGPDYRTVSIIGQTSTTVRIAVHNLADPQVLADASIVHLLCTGYQ